MQKSMSKVFHKTLTESEFERIKKITNLVGSNHEIVAKLAGRSKTTVKNIARSEDFRAYKEMTLGYIKKYQEKKKAQEAAVFSTIFAPTAVDVSAEQTKLDAIKKENEVLSELLHISKILEEVNAHFQQLVSNYLAKSQE